MRISVPNLPIPKPRNGTRDPIDLYASIEMVAQLFRQGHGKTVVMTGAGVSVDSGIPDYRGPKVGVGRRPINLTQADMARVLISSIKHIVRSSTMNFYHHILQENGTGLDPILATRPSSRQNQTRLILPLQPC